MSAIVRFCTVPSAYSIYPPGGSMISYPSNDVPQHELLFPDGTESVRFGVFLLNTVMHTFIGEERFNQFIKALRAHDGGRSYREFVPAWYRFFDDCDDAWYRVQDCGRLFDSFRELVTFLRETQFALRLADQIEQLLSVSAQLLQTHGEELVIVKEM